MAKTAGVIIDDATKEEIELYAELHDLDYESALEKLVRDGLELVSGDLREALKNKGKGT